MFSTVDVEVMRRFIAKDSHRSWNREAETSMNGEIQVVLTRIRRQIHVQERKKF